MILLLLALSALADPPETVYVEAEESVTAEVPSFLIAEERMDVLLAKAKSTDDLQVSLDLCVERGTEELLAARDSLVECRALRMEDSERILQDTIGLAQAEQRISRLRTQRNVAIGTSAGLVAIIYIAVKLSR